MEAHARRSFHIGRYHCVESLAQGPLGETFRAKVYGVAGLEKQYALKQLDAGLRGDPDARRRLVDGARLYAGLEHERIARLVELHDADDALFLVVDLGRGVELPRLFAHLKGRGETLPLEQALLIAVDVAEALEAAHRPTASAPGGVLHLGLVPASVVVLGEGEVRVSDFAIMNTLVRPGWSKEAAVLPVLGYMAPELVVCAHPTPATDAWAVGALLYELCTGRPLYEGATVEELTQRRAAPPSWERLPARPGLRELIEKLIDVDPARRPATAAQVRELLLGLIGLELTRARVGLQALAKRALGRALTRTGSFAAVAIPSAELPTLVQEPPAPKPVEPTLSARPRGWSPPRATSATPVVRAVGGADDSGPTKRTTVPGMGEITPPGDPDPLQMEMAELPPSGLGDTTLTDRNMDAIAFDDGVTAPQQRISSDDRIDALEAVSVELDLDEHDAITRQVDALPHNAVTRSEPALLRPGTSSHATTSASREALPPARPPALVLPTPVALHPLPGPPSAKLDVPAEGRPPSLEAPVTAPMPVSPPTVTAPMPVSSPTITAPSFVAAALPRESVAPPPAGAPSLAAPIASVHMQALESSDFAPVEPARKGSGKWIAAGLAALGIAVAAVVVVERGGWSAAGSDSQPVASPTPSPSPSPTPSPSPSPSPAPSPGKVTIVTTPAGAAVWIDHALVGTTPLSVPVAVGKHHLLLVRDGMKIIERNVGIDASGAAMDETLEPVKLPSDVAGEGGLKVRCRTTGELRIRVDGHDTGYTCPNADRISVAPGAHKIGLYSPRTGEVREVDGEIDDDPDHSKRIYVRF